MKKNFKSVKEKGYSKVKTKYFINGKMKFEILEFMDGIPIDEYYMKNLDPITAMQDGHYELLDGLNISDHDEILGSHDENRMVENENKLEQDNKRTVEYRIVINKWDEPPF